MHKTGNIKHTLEPRATYNSTFNVHNIELPPQWAKIVLDSNKAFSDKLPQREVVECRQIGNGAACFSEFLNAVDGIIVNIILSAL